MRKTGIALSAFALALTLGACGGNSGSGDNGNGGAANNSDAAAVNVAALAKSIGDKASAKNSAHMTMSGNFGGEQIEAEGDVSFDAANPSLTMDMTMAQGNMSMVLVDEVVYIKMPEGEEIEPGKPWFRIDTNSDNPLSKVFATLSEELSKNADPRTALEQFEEAGEITSTKEEELDGRQTTHYTIMVDVEKLAATKTDPTQKAALDAAIKAGLKDFPVELWIDEEDLPVRVSFDMPVPDGKGGTASAQMRMDYTDWGKAVDITAPPADRVAEFPGS